MIEDGIEFCLRQEIMELQKTCAEQYLAIERLTGRKNAESGVKMEWHLINLVTEENVDGDKENIKVWINDTSTVFLDGDEAEIKKKEGTPVSPVKELES